MLVLCIISLVLSVLSLALSTFVGYLLLGRFNQVVSQSKQLSDPDALNTFFSGMFTSLNGSSGGDDNEESED